MALERTRHRRVMHTKVAGNGAHLPAFHADESNDLSSDLGPDHERLPDDDGSLSEENRLPRPRRKRNSTGDGTLKPRESRMQVQRGVSKA
ncbi:MAG: hypothetical protein MUQ26_08515, partial [Armatimonadetes bacterium]|nr:hypothetical protein [Armatimonadota bacterium]